MKTPTALRGLVKLTNSCPAAYLWVTRQEEVVNLLLETLSLERNEKHGADKITSMQWNAIT